MWMKYFVDKVLRSAGSAFAPLHRKFGDSSNKLFEYAYKVPVKEQPPWRRLAEQIKGEGDTDSRYLNRLRQSYDTRDHLEKIEDEIREEMAQALGRTGAKCDYMFFQLEKAGKECDWLESAGKCVNKAASSEKKASVEKFNALRQDAMAARDELMIHRHAAGLRVRNQKIVEEFWPLPPKRPLS